ncbi:hypothetical protein SLA2020_409850 [Shorea laevis]
MTDLWRRLRLLLSLSLSIHMQSLMKKKRKRRKKMRRMPRMKKMIRLGHGIAILGQEQRNPEPLVVVVLESTQKQGIVKVNLLWLTPV